MCVCVCVCVWERERKLFQCCFEIATSRWDITPSKAKYVYTSCLFCIVYDNTNGIVMKQLPKSLRSKWLQNCWPHPYTSSACHILFHLAAYLSHLDWWPLWSILYIQFLHLRLMSTFIFRDLYIYHINDCVEIQRYHCNSYLWFHCWFSESRQPIIHDAMVSKVMIGPIHMGCYVTSTMINVLSSHT